MNTAELIPDYADAASKSTLDELNNILKNTFSGLPYLFARSSYGGELTLHFGSERHHDHPKLAHKIRGTHVLSVRGSAWMLRSGIKPVVVGCGVVPPDPPSAKPFNVTALESGALIGPSARVSNGAPFVVQPLNAIGLAIELTDGSSFLVLPTPPSGEDELPEPSDWELLTPNHVLRVGPGLHFQLEDHSSAPRPR